MQINHIFVFLKWQGRISECESFKIPIYTLKNDIAVGERFLYKLFFIKLCVGTYIGIM